MKKRSFYFTLIGLGAGILYLAKRIVQTRPYKPDVTAGEEGRDREHSRRTPQKARPVSSELSRPSGRSARRRSRTTNKVRRDRKQFVVIDDQGTDQVRAASILKHIRDNAFDASDEKLAIALGRPTKDIESLTSGAGVIDGDVIMKAKWLALQRGIAIE
jgi:hypothetical protein